MSIEFSCSKCGQNLRVSDEAAGKRAKCPKCSQVNQIPALPEPGLGELDDLDIGSLPQVPQAPMGPSGGDSPFGQSPQGSNPYSAPQTGFGSTLGATTSPVRQGKIHNVPVDVGSILNYSVEVWQNNLGILVGATVMVWAISVALSYGSVAIVAVLDRAGQHEVALLFNFASSIGSNLIGVYLGIGVSQLMLNLARRRRAEFNDVFNGGSRFLPVLGVSILFGFALFFGFLALIIPGIIILVIWWPCKLLVIDSKSTVFGSFELARTITQGNTGTILLVFFVGLGIALLGLLACCVGIFVAAPLVGMMWVVSYLMMSGQIPTEPGVAKRMV